jgi:hypothetical protein
VSIRLQRAVAVVIQLGGAEAGEDAVGLQPVDKAVVLAWVGCLGRWYERVERAEMARDVAEGWMGGGAG